MTQKEAIERLVQWNSIEAKNLNLISSDSESLAVSIERERARKTYLDLLAGNVQALVCRVTEKFNTVEGEVLYVYIGTDVVSVVARDLTHAMIAELEVEP